MMRRHSWNLWKAADMKELDRVVWADGGRNLIVNMLINGATGNVDKRFIRRPYDLWYKEMV